MSNSKSFNATLFTTYAELFVSFEKVLNIIFKFFNQTDTIRLGFINIIRKIKIFKNWLFNIIKNKSVFLFNENDTTKIKEWLINHSMEFQYSNQYSNVDVTNFSIFKKTENIQDLLIIEPKIEGSIYLYNTKISYFLDNDSITLYHFNKAVLNNTVQSLANYLKEKQYNDNKQVLFTPRIFKIDNELFVNKINNITDLSSCTNSSSTPNSWKFENTIYENVKLFLNEEDKKKFISCYDCFFNKPELYNKIGLCYKNVSCFSGNPGLGKTTTVKYLAQKYKRNIYIFNDLCDDAKTFLDLYNRVPSNSIILFDDFDKIKCKITPEHVVVLLNILDGVLTKFDSIVIFCLNDFSYLEKNFKTITRVGRIDVHIDFNLFKKLDTSIIIKEIYTEYTEEEILIYSKMLEDNDIKVSEIKNRCLKASGILSKAIRDLKESISGN